MICKKLLLHSCNKQPDLSCQEAQCCVHSRDDLGYGDIGVWTKEDSPPHLDQLAKDGEKFATTILGRLFAALRASLLWGSTWGIVMSNRMASCIPRNWISWHSNFSKERLYHGYGWGLMSSTWKDENLHAHYFPMATGFDYWYV